MSNGHGLRVPYKELDRALKWAWLARDEEDHASGMYAGKLKEAIEELQVFLRSAREAETKPTELPKPNVMTRDEADALAATIKARLPQAEVEVKQGAQADVWVVEARNPRRGTSQAFSSAERFERLMQAPGQVTFLWRISSASSPACSYSATESNIFSARRKSLPPFSISRPNSNGTLSILIGPIWKAYSCKGRSG